MALKRYSPGADGSDELHAPVPAGSRWHPKARQQPPSCGLANAFCGATDASRRFSTRVDGKAIAATPCLRAGRYGASHLRHTMLQPRPTSPHPTSSTLGARAQRREPQRLGHDEPQSHEPSLAQARRPPIALARPTTDRGSSRTLSLGPDGSTGRPHYHGRFEEGPPLQRLTPLTGSTLSTLPPSHQSSHRAAHLVTILHPPPLAAPQYQRSLASSRTRLCCAL